MASHALAFAVHSHHGRLTAPFIKARVRPPVQLPAVTSPSAPPLPCFDALSFRFSIHYQSMRPKLGFSHPEAATCFATSLLHLRQKSLSAARRTVAVLSQPRLSLSTTLSFISFPPGALCTNLPPGPPPASPSPLPPPPPPAEPHPLCLFALGDIQVGWTPVNHSALRGGLSAERR